MIAPESNQKDVTNVFKNDWSSVKEVEERIAAQKAKEKAEREEQARLKKLKEDADANKTQAEKEMNAKIDAAKGKQEEAEQRAKTLSDQLLIVSKDLENWKGLYNTFWKELARHEEEYPVKASTFNHQRSLALTYDNDALALVNGKVAPFWHLFVATD